MWVFKFLTHFVFLSNFHTTEKTKYLKRIRFNITAVFISFVFSEYVHEFKHHEYIYYELCFFKSIYEPTSRDTFFLSLFSLWYVGRNLQCQFQKAHILKPERLMKILELKWLIIFNLLLKVLCSFNITCKKKKKKLVRR